MRDPRRYCAGVLRSDRADALKLASELRNEFCIGLRAPCVRVTRNVNADMATGEIEVLASLTIINRTADSLPLDANHVNTEEARLKIYRYLVVVRKWRSA